MSNTNDKIKFGAALQTITTIFQMEWESHERVLAENRRLRIEINDLKSKLQRGEDVQA